MFSQRLFHVFACLVGVFLFSLAANAQEFTPDASSTAGLSGIDFGSGVWGDFDSDGDLDILLTGRNAQGLPSTAIYKNENGSFQELDARLPGVSSSTAAWGDFDNDDDLDIAVAGKDGNNQLITRIYRNDMEGSNPGFVHIEQSLVGTQAGSVEWGDYDNDGDLDLLVTGNTVLNKRVSVVYRNDLHAETGERTFTDIGAGIEGVFLGNGTWGDYDNDGDLDILLTGDSFQSGQITRVYRNNSGIFSNINASLTGLMLGKATWGDYDNDGDLDILSTGNDSQGQRKAFVYRNQGGQFVNIGASLKGVEAGSAVWGDCDNDGDLDILIIGLSEEDVPLASVFENDRGTFLEGVQIQGLLDGSAAWGDYDNDDDLDIMIAGKQIENDQRRIILYRNNSGVRNVPPSSPDGLNARFEGASFVLEWDASTDTETPAQGLTYNVRVGTAEFDEVLVGSMALNQGRRKLPATGNAHHNTFYTLNVDLQGLAPAPFLVWNVQAVDPGFAGSSFSETGFVYLAAGVPEVLDVPGDQGGQVIVQWEPSHLDVTDGTLTHYSIWRWIPEDSINIGAITLMTPADIPPEFEGTAIRRVPQGDDNVYWEWVGNKPVQGIEKYEFQATTAVDSSSAVDGTSIFMVVAHTSEPPIYFDSEFISGYSVDNIAPDQPLNVQAVKNIDGVILQWEASQEADFRQYLVYRGGSTDFEPSNATFLDATTQPAYVDDSSFPAGTFYYKVIAEDIHDNRSLASDPISVVINTSTDDPFSELPDEYSLHQNYPNPFNPNTLIQFDMPESGGARLAVYNAYGQQILVLLDRTMEAGQHTVSWQPVGLSSGTYYYRFESGNYVETKRMVFVK